MTELGILRTFRSRHPKARISAEQQDVVGVHWLSSWRKKKPVRQQSELPSPYLDEVELGLAKLDQPTGFDVTLTEV
jgi:hypothetical protein